MAFSFAYGRLFSPGKKIKHAKRLFLFVEDFFAGDILFDRLVFGIKKPRSALGAEFASFSIIA
jgi:hypothetical protein